MHVHVVLLLVFLLQLNQGQLTQLVSSLSSSQDDDLCSQLPDFIQGETGPVLTDLGRWQVRVGFCGTSRQPSQSGFNLNLCVCRS